MVNIKESSAFDYIRYVFSFALLMLSIVVTFYAILEQKTSFWKEVPGWAALIIFILVLIFLGILEGLQIALVELKRQNPTTYKDSHPKAHRLGLLASKGDNIEKFLMGRQVFVVCLVFFSAKLTTIHGGGEFLFPVPDIVQALLLETGLLACVTVVIVAQLTPQIVASLYPVQFLELMFNLPAFYLCLALEITGIPHFTWVLADLAATLGVMAEQEKDVVKQEKDVEKHEKDVEKHEKDVEKHEKDLEKHEKVVHQRDDNKSMAKQNSTFTFGNEVL